MPAQRYFPQYEADRVIWLNHYAAKIGEHGPRIGLSAEEIAATLADIAHYVWVLHTWYPATQQDALQATSTKNLIATGSGTEPVRIPAPTQHTDPPAAVLPGVLNRLFNQVQRIKLHPGYTDAIGQDLSVVATADTSDHPVPVFTAATEQGPKGVRVRLDYTKYGHDGINVESRVNGGPWLLLGSYTQKPAYDDRPPATPGTPETRDYRLRWWDKDEANGEYSAVQTVLVGG
jgi:hypothetical protein